MRNVRGFDESRIDALGGRNWVSERRRNLPALQEHLRMAEALPGSAQAMDAMRSARTGGSPAEHRADASDARVDVMDAVQVVQRMKADPGLTALLGTAKGVFILPDYGRGALIVGAQAGASAGSMALLLMSDRAVERFRSDRNFSLSADAGLSIGPYSQRT